MKKIALVSSFSESCGNAAFTKVLADSLKKYHQLTVHVADLDLHLTQSLDSTLRQKADIHIKKICKELAEADMVNIQLEAGLYGSYPKDILRRIRWLAESNKNISVTLHSPRLMSQSTPDKREAIKSILSGRIITGIKKYIKTVYSDVHVKLNRKIIKYLVMRNIPLIVHTLRAKTQINEIFGYKNVFVHPLKFVDERFAPEVQSTRKSWEDFGISSRDIVVGMFGYISSYKGHFEALHAIRLLPNNYKLLVFGRQHPQTLKSNGAVDVYLKQLIDYVDEFEMKDKVLFMGELDDIGFLNAAASVDVCWLPYFENGQDGSGIASICFDVSRRVLCSTSFAFDELLRLIPYRNAMRFDIGNYYEMSSKTLALMRNSWIQRASSPDQTYTVRSQTDMYISVYEGGKIANNLS